MMPKLFETIKIENQSIENLQWHNRRLNKSRLALFHKEQELNLANFIELPNDKECYRCRVVYAKEIESIEYIPYQPKKIERIKIVQSTLDYEYKFNDRQELNVLLDENYDEILIEKEGLLTDTSIANIAFYDGASWFTPKTPLLEGTTRARLLADGFLKLKDIRKEDIKNYSHVALMNAMIGFQIKKSINIRY